MEKYIYQLGFIDSLGSRHQMSEFKGKLIIVVNTATKCGLTPQFEGLEALFQKYKDQGLIILGFPCNQFANQEPEDNKNMASSCKINFGVTFPLSEKIDVNGENTHPIFQYLKTKTKGFLTKKIKWNFTKFLIDRDGKPIKRFSPIEKPYKIESFLKANFLVK